MQLPGVPTASGPCRGLDPGEGKALLDRAFGGWGPGWGGEELGLQFSDSLLVGALVGSPKSPPALTLVKWPELSMASPPLASTGKAGEQL